ncbi:MAG: SagB/ThcOx family dehydrogenase [Acidobacteriota bacterium]
MENRTLRSLRRAVGAASRSWEIYHENSKLTQFDIAPPGEWVVQEMERYTHSLDFRGRPEFKLPADLDPLQLSLGESITQRVSTRKFSERAIAFRELATLLHYSYGINRTNEGTGFPRPFRNVPSGGALYPLDIFCCVRAVDGLSPGLYHFHPPSSSLRLLAEGDWTRQLSPIVVQQELSAAAVMLFIVAQFERALFKYKDRGYRFVLLDAGHLAQNINLASTALGLGSVDIGGYFDRKADDFVGVDGLLQSTIYMVAVGHKQAE